MLRFKTLMGVGLLLALLGILPGIALGASQKERVTQKYSNKESKFYTAYNLFAEHGHVYAINFQVGQMIPAGTPVEIRFIDDYSNSPYGRAEPAQQVKFTTLTDGRSYTLFFTDRYHPGQTIYDYVEKMFTDKSFAEQTVGKSPEVIDAIRRGAVIPGMSKQEVILAYGYPPEHRTYSQNSNTWTYWTNRRKTKKICFDLNETAVPCSEQRSNDL